jgi:hypothetical protein
MIGMPCNLRALETDIVDIIKAVDMPDAERLLYDQRREYEAALQRQAIQLIALWHNSPAWEQCMT